ncbi:MAG: rhodanese-like domain-containing protein [Proteobacteria bacterium]|nr:rhodanese-like domain-containing protein [Pseudomonadota bacterium]
MNQSSYAGDVTPDEAWRLLKNDPDAALVDVRTDAEWSYVGGPDLAPLNKDLVHLQWKMFPGMAVNPAFSDQVAKAVPSRDAPILFLCRSGQRSRDTAIALTQRGYTRCYNITDGFEGPPDASGHRGTVAGWKVAGLPWKQP